MHGIRTEVQRMRHYEFFYVEGTCPEHYLATAFTSGLRTINKACPNALYNSHAAS